MRNSIVAVLVASLAGTTFAAPMSAESASSASVAASAESSQGQAKGAFFEGIGGNRGNGGNIFSDIFDTAACLVSGVIGGGNPECKGRRPVVEQPSVVIQRPPVVVEPPAVQVVRPNPAPVSTGSAYSYNWSTNSDGSYTYIINPKGRPSCTFTVAASDARAAGVIANGLAQQC